MCLGECSGQARLAGLPGLHLRPVEILVRAGWSGAALILVARAVDVGAIRVLGRGTGPEQAQLADLHPRPELDRKRRDVGELQRHVAGEAGVDPARSRVREQAEPAETRLA